MSTTDATILLAEEHDATRAFLEDNLRADGYRVLVAADRAKALALLGTAHPDLMVVDVNGQTLELLDAVRSGDGIAGNADPDTPMIVLSRDADRLQRIRLLERGGDDVIRKPFAYPELRARIGAVLRRSRATRRPADRARRADRDRRALARGAGVRAASRAVGDGVRAAGRAGRGADIGCSRARSCSDRSGGVTRSRTRTLDSHAFRLRHKLCDGTDDRLVINVWGVGYRLLEAVSAS